MGAVVLLHEGGGIVRVRWVMNARVPGEGDADMTMRSVRALGAG